MWISHCLHETSPLSMDRLLFCSIFCDLLENLSRNFKSHYKLTPLYFNSGVLYDLTSPNSSWMRYILVKIVREIKSTFYFQYTYSENTHVFEGTKSTAVPLLSQLHYLFKKKLIKSNKLHAAHSRKQIFVFWQWNCRQVDMPHVDTDRNVITEAGVLSQAKQCAN